MFVKDNKFRIFLIILLGSIILTVILHLFWHVVSLLIGTDNRVINDITNRFGLDEELSFPTWVNSMLALTAGVLAWIVGKNHSVHTKKVTWYVIAFVCLMISIDEVVALHELLLQGLHILANFGEGQQGLFANAWILVLPALLVGIFFFMKLMHQNLPKDTIKRLFVAIFIYLAGAFIVEYLSIPLNKSSTLYNFGAVVLEESLELLGVWLIIRAILAHIVKHESVLYRKITDII